MVVLGVLFAAAGLAFGDTDNQVSLVEGTAAIALFALLGVVIVLLTIWLSDDEPEEHAAMAHMLRSVQQGSPQDEPTAG